MLVQKVKVTAVGDPVAYQKKENNTPLKTPDGQDVVGWSGCGWLSPTGIVRES